jgi:hypothetical protein
MLAVFQFSVFYLSFFPSENLNIEMYNVKTAIAHVVLFGRGDIKE